MDGTQVYHFTVKRAELQEAMIAAGRMLLSTRSKAVQWVLTIVLIVLCGLGGMAATVFTVRGAGGGLGSFAPIAGWLLGGFAFIAFQNVAYGALAKGAAAARLHTGPQTVEVSKAGIAFGTGNSRWQTGWAEVEGASETRRTVIFSIGGVAIYVPKTAIGTLEEARALVAYAKERVGHA